MEDVSKKKDIALTLAGVAIGLALGAPVAAAALTATPSTQHFYLDGRPISLTAYAIDGNNYVKLRDIGRVVDFGVTYDGSTNSVYIDPDANYREESSQTADLSMNMEIRSEIVRLVNEARRGVGVPALTVSAALMDAAQDCSGQGFTKHDIQYECEAVSAYGYPYGSGAGLTVFTGVAREDIAQHAVDNWIASPGHYQTMVADRYDCIGVGVSIIGGTAYCYLFVGDPDSINAYG